MDVPEPAAAVELELDVAVGYDTAVVVDVEAVRAGLEAAPRPQVVPPAAAVVSEWQCKDCIQH